MPKKGKQYPSKASKQKTTFICETCRKSFTRMDSLKRHQRSHNTTQRNPDSSDEEAMDFRFKCRICGKFYSRKDLLKRHQRNIHGMDHAAKDHDSHKELSSSGQQESQSESSSAEDPKKLKCAQCSQPFSSEYLLRRHMESVHDKDNRQRYQCPQCSKSFLWKVSMLRHLKRNCPQASSSRTRFVCATCGKECSRSDLLKRHEQCHYSKRKFPCNLCGKEFKRKDALIRHQNTHKKDETTYQCSVCGKVYTNRRNLKRHQETHEKDAKFCCDLCGKEFSRRDGLQRHQLVHKKDDDALFVCQICLKTFVRKDELKSHENVHTEKEHRQKFTCEPCKKSFQWKSGFQRHLKYYCPYHQNTIRRNHECSACGKAFSRPDSLKRHLRIHHSYRVERLCDQCGRCFKRSWDFLTHLKIHHRIRRIRRGGTFRCYRCRLCSRYFLNKKSLQQHKERHAEGPRKRRVLKLTDAFKINKADQPSPSKQGENTFVAVNENLNSTREKCLELIPPNDSMLEVTYQFEYFAEDFQGNNNIHYNSRAKSKIRIQALKIVDPTHRSWTPTSFNLILQDIEESVSCLACNMTLTPSKNERAGLTNTLVQHVIRLHNPHQLEPTELYLAPVVEDRKRCPLCEIVYNSTEEYVHHIADHKSCAKINDCKVYPTSKEKLENIIRANKNKPASYFATLLKDLFYHQLLRNSQVMLMIFSPFQAASLEDFFEVLRNRKSSTTVRIPIYLTLSGNINYESLQLFDSSKSFYILAATLYNPNQEAGYPTEVKCRRAFAKNFILLESVIRKQSCSSHPNLEFYHVGKKDVNERLQHFITHLTEDDVKETFDLCFQKPSIFCHQELEYPGVYCKDSKCLAFVHKRATELMFDKTDHYAKPRLMEAQEYPIDFGTFFYSDPDPSQLKKFVQTAIEDIDRTKERRKEFVYAVLMSKIESDTPTRSNLDILIDQRIFRKAYQVYVGRSLSPNFSKCHLNVTAKTMFARMLNHGFEHLYLLFNSQFQQRDAEVLEALLQVSGWIYEILPGLNENIDIINNKIEWKQLRLSSFDELKALFTVLFDRGFIHEKKESISQNVVPIAKKAIFISEAGKISTHYPNDIVF